MRLVISGKIFQHSTNSLALIFQNTSDYQVDFLGNYYLQFFSLVYYPNLNLDYIFQLLQYFNLPSSAQNAFIIIDKLVLYLLSLFKSYETNFQTNFIQKRLIEKTKQLGTFFS